MEPFLAVLFVAAALGIPSVGIIFLYYKYESEYVGNILFLFFMTMVCVWGADSIWNDVMKLSSPCNYNANPILYQLLFYSQCSIVPDSNLLPLQFTGRYIDWGFFFERLLIDYASIWTSFIVFYWGILKAIFEDGWTNNQWVNYTIWSFIILQIIIHPDHNLFDLYYAIRDALRDANWMWPLELF